MPRYPKYTTQPFTGRLPSLFRMGPPDTLPSSAPGPHYLRSLTHGRYLSGLGAEAPSAAPAAEPPADDSNELRRMENEDDVSGNGIFDDSKRVTGYKDAGIFQNRYSLPGYVDRSKSFAKSEVRDITTNLPIVYVPGGAVSIDDNAKMAFLTGNTYAPLRNLLPPHSELPSVQTDSVAVNNMAVTAAAAATQDPSITRATGKEVTNFLTPDSPLPPSSSAPVVVVPSITTDQGMSTLKLALIAAAVGFGIGWLASPNKKAKTP